MHFILVLVAIFGSAASFGASIAESFELSVGNGEIVAPLLLALVAGFFTSLSPCVYPLIPITLSVMGARRYNSRLQGFLVALCYVLGMSLLYSALGVIFASLGMLLGALMQHPVVLIMIAIFFAVLSLSMLGVFNFVMPPYLIQRLARVGGQGKRGAFLMGMVSGLIAAPCTGPVLGFILTLIANTESVVFAVVLMLVFSFGLGAPFLALGTFSQAITRIPKSGAWMNSVKSILGAGIMGAALYYLALVIPALAGILSTIRGLGVIAMVLFIVSGVVLIVSRAAMPRLWPLSVVGVFLTTVAISSLLMIEDGPAHETHDEANAWHMIDSAVTDEKAFDNMLEEARGRGLPVLVDFYADWCAACRQLDQKTLSNPSVVQQLNKFYLIRIDATTSSPYVSKLENRFKVIGLPTVIFIKKDGSVADDRVLGFISPTQFISTLKRID